MKKLLHPAAAVVPALTLVIVSTAFLGCNAKQASSTGTDEKVAMSAQQDTTTIAAAPAGGISKGQQVFLSNCSTCHAGAGNPPGPNGRIQHSDRLETEDSFRALLRKPESPRMPSFADSDLSNADVHSLYEYLKTQRLPGGSPENHHKG